MGKDIAEKEQKTALAEQKTVTGLGLNITQEDIRLPRIELTQALSATVKDGTHKAGILINSLTKEALAAPTVIVPVFVFKSVIRWKPRKEGGGILYKTTDITDEVREDLAWNGDNKPVATAYINVVCIAKGEDMPIVASFCNTSYKTGQDLLTMIALSGTAWSYSYTLSAVATKNAQGDFFKFGVRRGEVTSPAQRAEAMELYKKVSTMAIDADYEGDTSTSAAESATSNPDNL